MRYDLVALGDYFPVTLVKESSLRSAVANMSSQQGYQATQAEIGVPNGPIRGSRSTPHGFRASRFLLQQLHRFGNRIQDDRGEQAEQHGGNHHDAEAYGEWPGG